MAEQRKYWVKANYRFNLDSMHDHIWCLIYDIRDGMYDKVTIMGKEMDIDDLEAFKDEVEELLMKANFGKVTGREYGRIKAIAEERNMIRYCRCLASGMDESKAAYAFMD